ncbi:hypothetical protein GY45DRAFT_985791 [Cubamyces sp. BRFM 1775]|nr:hypothetical protein GY45DRAFT_985791 [Cubamyces sp. BRFM 1775]
MQSIFSPLFSSLPFGPRTAFIRRLSPCCSIALRLVRCVVPAPCPTLPRPAPALLPPAIDRHAPDLEDLGCSLPPPLYHTSLHLRLHLFVRPRPQPNCCHLVHPSIFLSLFALLPSPLPSFRSAHPIPQQPPPHPHPVRLIHYTAGRQ